MSTRETTGSRTAERATPERLTAAPDLHEVRRRQREEFGLSWGSAFFGWLVAVGVATLLIALLSAAYNVLSGLNLPRIPVDEGALTTGGLIVLAAVLIGTLLAALAGGKAGSHYHRKVDRVGH